MNLLVLSLEQSTVSTRTNSFLSLPVQVWRFLLLHCYLTWQHASWMSLWVPGAGSPTGLEFTSKELLRGVEPACSWEGSGNYSLISFFTTCLKVWTAPLCPGENRRRRPHSFPDKEAQAFPSCFLCFRIFPDGLWKETWTPSPLMSSLLSYMGQGSKLHCPHVDLLKLFYFPS